MPRATLSERIRPAAAAAVDPVVYFTVSVESVMHSSYRNASSQTHRSRSVVLLFLRNNYKSYNFIADLFCIVSNTYMVCIYNLELENVQDRTFRT